MDKMYKTLHNELGPQLSAGADISKDKSQRWSSFEAPEPIAVVHVNSEDDVVNTVKYCNSNFLPFIVQSGGHGWARFSYTENLIMIDLSQLDTVVVASNKQTAIIGGGANVRETIAAADAAGVIIQTGNCNSVGTLGAALGGGFVTTLGMFGMGVDSIMEMRVVTANGELMTVSETQNADLFWAMRGAGPNFGVVTSAIVKAYEVTERNAWAGALIFTPDKLEQVLTALEYLKLSRHMMTMLYYASGGTATHDPVVVVTVWLFQGTPQDGRSAYECLYNIGPIVDTTSILSYTEWNTGSDPVCATYGRKPTFAAGLDKLDPKVWRQVWNAYKEFQARPGAEASVVLLEIYPMTDARFVHEGRCAFAHRSTRYQAMIIPMYEDVSLDHEAIRTGSKIRDLWRSNNGKEKNATYVNFCFGDEPLEEVYGENLKRLQELKLLWDPKNRFNQWFNIC